MRIKKSKTVYKKIAQKFNDHNHLSGVEKKAKPGWEGLREHLIISLIVV